jgi:hypothetical protein
MAGLPTTTTARERIAPIMVEQKSSRFSLLAAASERIMLHMGAVLQLPMLCHPMGALLTRPVVFVSPESSFTAIIHSYSYPANERAGGELLKGGSQHLTA